MPVRKFRSVTEMPSPSPLPPLDPQNLKLACDLSTMASRLRPLRFPPGVYKHRFGTYGSPITKSDFVSAPRALAREEAMRVQGRSGPWGQEL